MRHCRKVSDGNAHLYITPGVRKSEKWKLDVASKYTENGQKNVVWSHLKNVEQDERHENYFFIESKTIIVMKYMKKKKKKRAHSQKHRLATNALIVIPHNISYT